MGFLLHGLDASELAPWFGLSDAELIARGARRRIADSMPGYPCRVSLADAAIGEEVLLVPYEHHPTTSPYRGSGPVYVRHLARGMAPVTLDRVPDVLARRMLSVRAYDDGGMMLDADVVGGRELAVLLERMMARPTVAYAHVHFARPGCFACRVTAALTD